MKEPRSVLITGVSSGIGAALARAYAGPGVHLALGGRDRARLQATAERCQAQGAAVAWRSIDVADEAATADWVTASDEARPLDLVVANAGIAQGLTEGIEDAEGLRRMIEVNLFGTLNTIMPAVPRMRARGRGQIALMSSLAAIRGLAGAQGYCAGKAAVKALGEAMRPMLAADGVAVNVIVPGFVRTPMNEDKGFPTPLRIEPERAAAIIRRGLARNRPLIAFPRTLYWGMRLLALWPRLADAIAMRAARQAAAKEKAERALRP